MLSYVVRVETLIKLLDGSTVRRSKTTLPATSMDDCKAMAAMINRSNKIDDTTARQATPCVSIGVRTASYVIPLDELEETTRALTRALDEHQHRTIKPTLTTRI